MQLTNIRRKLFVKIGIGPKNPICASLKVTKWNIFVLDYQTALYSGLHAQYVLPGFTDSGEMVILWRLNTGEWERVGRVWNDTYDKVVWPQHSVCLFRICVCVVISACAGCDGDTPVSTESHNLFHSASVTRAALFALQMPQVSGHQHANDHITV